MLWRALILFAVWACVPGVDVPVPTIEVSPARVCPGSQLQAKWRIDKFGGDDVTGSGTIDQAPLAAFATNPVLVSAADGTVSGPAPSPSSPTEDTLTFTAVNTLDADPAKNRTATDTATVMMLPAQSQDTLITCLTGCQVQGGSVVATWSGFYDPDIDAPELRIREVTNTEAFDISVVHDHPAPVPGGGPPKTPSVALAAGQATQAPELQLRPPAGTWTATATFGPELGLSCPTSELHQYTKKLRALDDPNFAKFGSWGDLVEETCVPLKPPEGETWPENEVSMNVKLQCAEFGTP